MTTLLYTHLVCAEHNPGAHHPECPERLQAIKAALGMEAFAALDRRLAPKADVAQVERIHAPSYVKAVLSVAPESGIIHLDGDTAMSEASGEAALCAVYVETDDSTGLASYIAPLRLGGRLASCWPR